MIRVILNDRLLLGLKGTMSEFELNLLRQRSLGSDSSESAPGELQFRLPVGFRWTRHGKVEVDPDRRVQDAIHLVFTKVGELGSARQVLLWFRGEKIELPALVLDSPGTDIEWKLPVYNTIWHMLRNPMYAGAYAFGKTESRTKVVDGRARKSEGHLKPFDDMDGLDSRSPSRLHYLGAVRKQSIDAGPERTYEIAHGAEGRPGRPESVSRACCAAAGVAGCCTSPTAARTVRCLAIIAAERISITARTGASRSADSSPTELSQPRS